MANDNKRYSPLSSDASIDDKKKHVFSCVDYIYNKIIDIYNNSKMLAKIEQIYPNASFKKFYVVNEINKNHFSIENDEQFEEKNEIVKFFLKKSKKSFTKLFSLIVEYEDCWDFINKDLEELVSLSYDPPAIKKISKFDKVILNCESNFEEKISFFQTDAGLELLLNIIKEIYYQDKTELSYTFPNLVEKDVNFLFAIFHIFGFGKKITLLFNRKQEVKKEESNAKIEDDKTKSCENEQKKFEDNSSSNTETQSCKRKSTEKKDHKETKRKNDEDSKEHNKKTKTNEKEGVNKRFNKK